MKQISVHLPYLTQEIVIFKDETYSYLNKFLLSKNYSKILLLIDSNCFNTSWEEYLDILKPFVYSVFKLDPIAFSKDIDYLSFVLKSIYGLWFSRNSVIICVWWWFVWDLWWFLAWIYMRWIDFIQIWTTLMSQVDAIIWKVWINVSHKKNVIWLFYSPVLTIADISSLLILDKKEVNLAVSELFKHELINKKSNIDICFENLKRIADLSMEWISLNNADNRINLINNSLLIKKLYVENDPYDKNWCHKALSLWHTIANVLENLNSDMRHWEAVWIWIYISLFFSIYKYPQKKYLFTKLREFIYKTHKFNYKHIELSFIEIVDILKKDKISTNWDVYFVILEDIGKINIVADLPYNIIKDGFEDVFTLKWGSWLS